MPAWTDFAKSSDWNTKCSDKSKNLQQLQDYLMSKVINTYMTSLLFDNACLIILHKYLGPSLEESGVRSIVPLG